jgi:uncharacterized SAM-binding protein YcdF (DUF218 family)
MLYVVIKLVVLPPTCFFLLFLIGWILKWWRPTLGRCFLWALFVIVYLTTTPFAAGELMAPLERYPALNLERPELDVGAIVVLGAGVDFSAPEYWDPGAPSFGVDVADSLGLQRLAYAAYLSRATGLPIVLSGGASGSSNGRTIAEAMNVTLTRDFGLPARWLEEQSSSTMENAEYVAPLLREHGIHKIYLVTHAWHMWRAMIAFERTGIEVVPAPTGFVARSESFLQDFLPSSQALHLAYYGIYEWLGIAWYRLNDEGNLPTAWQ